MNYLILSLENKHRSILKMKMFFYCVVRHEELKTKKNKKFTGLVFGIIPEYQGMGIDAYMIAETGKMVLILPYTEYEMQWVGDFNPKMINMIRTMADTYPSRKLKTFRYIFDRGIEFKRHPIF